MNKKNMNNQKYIDPKVVGVGILEIDGKILLVKRGIEPGYGLWSMPSGYINRFEKVEDAIERELLEECGIIVKAEWISGVYSSEKSPIILLVWNLSYISGDVKPLDETLEVAFYSINKMPKLAFEHDEKIISDWIRLKKIM
ncbi:MAG: NUDIX hydrolase [SAR202 cluster bacterium]|nr:NUDIX hydrolase [Chloroflexota bacterium]MQF84463.1 NUDIX hydrolase [SAR202 cluster bacterium]